MSNPTTFTQAFPFLLTTTGITPEQGIPSNIIAGQPQTKTWNQFSDAQQQFFCGIWHSSAGCWHVNYSEDELCFLLKGRVILTGVDGQKYTFKAGQAFIIPKGFKGSWETVEPVEKIYAIYQPQSGE